MATRLSVFWYSLCWPVLVPQMMGVPLLEGDVMENWSVAQSPMAPPGVLINKMRVSDLQEPKLPREF